MIRPIVENDHEGVSVATIGHSEFNTTVVGVGG